MGMAMKSSDTVKAKLIKSFAAAGISASAAFFALNITTPSEGLSEKVYLDPVSLPTVCVGHMDKKLKVGQTFTLDECMSLFAEDWKKHQDQLNSIVRVPYKSEWEQAALVDFTFNVGIGKVESSTLIKLLNEGRHEEACAQLTRWVYANGKRLNGLVTRRNLEKQYCLGQIPWDKQEAFVNFKKEYKNEVAQELETDSKKL